MSEGRNPIAYVWDEDYTSGPKVALLEGVAKSRRELEGLDPETWLTTMVLERSKVGPWPWMRRLEGKPWQEPFEPDTEALAFMGCNDNDLEWAPNEEDPPTEYKPCDRPAVAILNGISGPGFAMECAKHVVRWQDTAQIWRPIKLRLRELDSILAEGLEG